MQYEVSALGKATQLIILMLFVLLPIGIVALTMVTVNDQMLTWKIAWPVAVIMFLIGLSCLRREVCLEDMQLQIKAALYTHRVAVAEIDLDQVRIIDLAEQPQEKPKWRSNGFSLPGFHAGYYRGRNKQKMFCLITAPNVLKLPLQNGTVVMLSLEQPQILLERLQHLTRG